MELRHLRYFVAVAEECNFTRAAKRLHIAQPPLSRQIQQLEEALGVQLFERNARPLKLTDTGRFFYSHAVQLLAQTAELESMTKRVGKIERSLSVGFVGSTLYGMLPKLIRRFRDENSAVELSLHEMSTMDQIKALKEGRIDVGFGRIRHEDPSVRRVVLREERMIVALPLGHPLSLSKAVLSLHDLINETLIIFPKAPRPSYADQVLAAFHDRTLKPQRIYETRELQIALGLVAAGEGISIVPSSVHGLKRDDVSYRELDDPNLVSPIIMSVRMLDESTDVRGMLELIYGLYEEEEMAYLPPHDG
ncbi:HTH-type transcriptional regulator BenM [Paraburkholderia domus]|jgi:Transcriptional regulator|uniref:HTH-type transcriptional regulator BenM n=1 Tax=Paraburkholderia domus TaxID=2793075 RepID=A0A9N8R4I4_9BURK|nr:LysR family transcriptional regulator [Paraburkholderia domus]MBK5052771.1 LysR family transcriptional regulator [Burkholderia sp. R-70006]MBK5063521.1 LysR family transcriptional regulator [Burkholderia sp. R-70199]MBK5088488.1 LysR family transcriptional regulator [Burkholderia sp. R-69927]MBK5123698.1 LysR family transcriptional regulator [Burkholderia sp. R-69980]MBK5169112.1 LysR family transcriptional regulator [Burkholderia sp. R-70211]MBK5183621.1 LysR family transcriptional regula